METTVRDLMTSPPVTCAADDTLAVAAQAMQGADTGSVVVTEDDKVVGILTERDLLRAAAGAGDPRHEAVRLLMTARPDVLGPDERVDAAWASLTSHHYRHLPVVDGRPLCRRRLLARPDGCRSHPARRRNQRRRAGGPRGSRRGRDDDRRRPRTARLLPLPPVLRRRSSREALVRGRLVPALPRRAPRCRSCGRVRRGRASSAHDAGRAEHAASRAGSARHPPRRAAHRRLVARRRARAGDPRTTSTSRNCPATRWHCAPSSRPSSRPRIAYAMGRSPSSRIRSSASRRTTSTC